MSVNVVILILEDLNKNGVFTKPINTQIRENRDASGAVNSIKRWKRILCVYLI